MKWPRIREMNENWEINAEESWEDIYTQCLSPFPHGFTIKD